MLGIDAETTPAAASAITTLVRSCQNRNSLEKISRQPSSEELPQPPASDIRGLVVGSDFGGYATFLGLNSESSSITLVLAALQAEVT
jgi:phosphoinositide-3-kinase, regulatory subunit 4